MGADALLNLIGEASAQIIIYSVFIWVVWWFLTKHLKQRDEAFTEEIHKLLENSNREHESAANERKEMIFKFETVLKDEREMHKSINQQILDRMVNELDRIVSELASSREQHLQVEERIAGELRNIHDMHARIVSIVVAVQSNTAEDASVLYNRIVQKE